MGSERDNWNINTRLNHPQDISLLDGNKPLVGAIYQSVKYAPSDKYPFSDQFIYSRGSNPTTRRLEIALAEIQNKEDCIVTSSGIAALTGTFLSLLAAGDHVITFRELYKPSRLFIKNILSRYQIEHTLLSLLRMDELESAIRPGKTKLIHFESPTNPNLDIADIEKITTIARKHGVLVSMDGTFAGLHQHNQYDIDIMIHSLTKFGNGHGDVMAGSISGSKALIKTIREMTIYLGATPDPHSSYLVERGLKTYMLRYERQTKTAAKIADFLIEHPKVKCVRYPGLKNHRGHELAKKQMQDMGAVIAFEIDPEVATSADKFCHMLKLIQLTASIGSTESIICPSHTFFGQELSSEDKNQIGLNNYSLRLSIGLEDPKDLIEDLKVALG